VELLHGGVHGAELEKREQSSPKHTLNLEKKGTLVILPLLFNGDFAPLFLTL
jgi:hypothetical protein